MSTEKGPIVIAVLGTTPPVVTETLYCLAREGAPPGRLLVLTTGGAAARLCRQWAGMSGTESMEVASAGALATLCSRLDQDLAAAARSRVLGKYETLRRSQATGSPAKTAPSRLPMPSIEVRIVRGPGGEPLDDVDGQAAAAAFSRLCVEAVRDATGEGNSNVIASIAGGRKTMGAALMQAMTFYAQPGCRVVHVLATPGFERSGLYYPGQTWSAEEGGEPPSSKPTDVRLYDMEVAPLGRLQRLSGKGADPKEIAEEVRRLLATPGSGPTLELKTRTGQVLLNGEALDVPRRRLKSVFSWLLVVASAKAACLEQPGDNPTSCRGCAACAVRYDTLAEGATPDQAVGLVAVARHLQQQVPAELRGGPLVALTSHRDGDGGDAKRRWETLRKTFRHAVSYLGEAIGAGHPGAQATGDALLTMTGHSSVMTSIDRSNLSVDGRTVEEIGADCILLEDADE